MPRYFFNLRLGGELIADLEGQEVPDIEAAIVEATASAREMLAESVRTGE